jgi:hypothetical protein
MNTYRSHFYATSRWKNVYRSQMFLTKVAEETKHKIYAQYTSSPKITRWQGK